MTTYHLLNSHLHMLHPFPFHSRLAAETFRDKLGCDDEIVERSVKMLSEDESEEQELDLEVERTIETEENKYPEVYDEYR